MTPYPRTPAPLQQAIERSFEPMEPPVNGRHAPPMQRQAVRFARRFGAGAAVYLWGVSYGAVWRWRTVYETSTD